MPKWIWIAFVLSFISVWIVHSAGQSRRARKTILDLLRSHGSLTVQQMSHLSGFSEGSIHVALAGLSDDNMVARHLHKEGDRFTLAGAP
jgi:DNA-binding transcriptional regulator GbsR (MarR family)